MSESLNDALIECIKCCGGSKVVGTKLWPEKSIDAAQRLLLDCLNPDRPAHLTPDQMMLVMRLGRERGCHDVMEFLASDLGYAKPQPTDPKDELAELLRQRLEMGKTAAMQDARIERLLSVKHQLKAAA